MSRVRVGTSGWSYPSGEGTWNGIFYPEKKSKTFDELGFYAEHFDTVEVNSSFYRVPAIKTTQDWVKRTPARFEFSLKLFQKFTHPDMFLKATGKDPADLDRKDVDEFRAAIEPIAAAGKLGALLAQFPASFKDGLSSRDYLADLLRAFSGYPVAVELRHRSWSDGIGDTLALLNAFGAALVQIDEPKFRFSIRQNYLPNVLGFYYMRLHGRNAEKWWRHEKSEERYDYLYSAGELKEFSDTADAAKRLVRKLYLYTNNHFSAKSVANAAMIKQQLGEPIEGEYSPEFIERYPELAGALTPSRTFF